MAPDSVPAGSPDNPLAIGEPGGPPSVLLPFTELRRTTAEHMREQLGNVAPVTVFAEVDTTAVTACRARLRPEVEAVVRVPLTYMPFFIQATVAALKAVPVLNARLTEEGHLIERAIHLGMATSVYGGVLMPVLRHAEAKSTAELAAEVHRLADAARWGQLRTDDQHGHTFCITNQGRWGQTLFGTPIIKAPNVGVLAFETIRPRPAVVDGQVAVRPMMYISLTFDHRALDGSEAAQFISVIREYLEGL